MVRTAHAIAALVAATSLVGIGAVRAHGDPSSPAVEQRRQPASEATAETEYDRGVRARVVQDWPTAEDAFRNAVALRPAFPDAWNELGYALRNQGRYDESLAAYGEALRIRPDFPEALEYLGEAYVKMGRIDDARQVLTRLRPLDPHRADELDEAIRRHGGPDMAPKRPGARHGPAAPGRSSILRGVPRPARAGEAVAVLVKTSTT